MEEAQLKQQERERWNIVFDLFEAGRLGPSSGAKIVLKGDIDEMKKEVSRLKENEKLKYEQRTHENAINHMYFLAKGVYTHMGRTVPDELVEQLSRMQNDFQNFKNEQPLRNYGTLRIGEMEKDIVTPE
jgi:hypothetical protein